VLKISKDKALRGKTCYSCKIDVWAAGVLAYTMLSGKNPFNR
jgi:serine/threonine protein kinase